MPLFDYRCEQCDKEFEALVSGERTPECPACGSRDLEKQLAGFAVGASNRSSAATPGSCSTCGDPRGPGACQIP